MAMIGAAAFTTVTDARASATMAEDVAAAMTITSGTQAPTVKGKTVITIATVINADADETGEIIAVMSVAMPGTRATTSTATTKVEGEIAKIFFPVMVSQRETPDAAGYGKVRVDLLKTIDQMRQLTTGCRKWAVSKLHGQESFLSPIAQRSIDDARRAANAALHLPIKIYPFPARVVMVFSLTVEGRLTPSSLTYSRYY